MKPLIECTSMLLIAWVALVAQTGAPAGPETAPLKLKAESRLVLVDAVVTGKKDEPVHGLTKDDFRLFEDGKEQVITAFQSHLGPAAQGISQQQHFVLWFTTHSGDDWKWIQQAASKFIEDNAGPNRLMSVIYSNRCIAQIGTQFTTDVGELRSALGKWPEQLRFSTCDRALWPKIYTNVAQDLAHVPGHKVVVLFTAPAPPSVSAAARRPPPPTTNIKRMQAQTERNAEAHQDPYQKEMQLEFRKADISVYPVESQVGAQTPGWALTLADLTGGHELSRGNDVLAVFDLIAREQDESYTLAYVPKDSPEGSCHALKVTVGRSDVKVRGRNLYCNTPQVSLAAASPLERELENLAASPGAGSGTEASASVPFFYESASVARVYLALHIPAPVLSPTEASGKLSASMDVLGLAYNLGGAVTARFSDTVKFQFNSRRQYEDFLRQPLRYEHQFQIAPGNYRFKLIFRTAKDHLGVVETPLAVDPFVGGRLGLSPIALSRDVQPESQEALAEDTEQGRKPLIFRGNRIAVSGSDLFLKTGIAEAYFEIYDPQPPGADPLGLTMHLRLFDAGSADQKWDSDDVDLSTLAKSGSAKIPVALRLPVSALPPGSYRAELTVKDSAGNQAARDIRFRLE